LILFTGAPDEYGGGKQENSGDTTHFIPFPLTDISGQLLGQLELLWRETP
jgi:hypothetical protein